MSCLMQPNLVMNSIYMKYIKCKFAVRLKMYHQVHNFANFARFQGKVYFDFKVQA